MRSSKYPKILTAALLIRQDPCAFQSVALEQGEDAAIAGGHQACKWTPLPPPSLSPAEARLTLQLHLLVHHTAHHAPLIQRRRLQIISQGSNSPDTAKLLHALIKHVRAMGKWWRVMIAIDPKAFCNVEGVTGGIGWWWGEVGGVVAGTDGAVAEDGMCWSGRPGGHC